MRVLIDATALPQNRGGVGRYVNEIITRLPALGIDTHVAAQPRDLEIYTAALGRDHVHLCPREAERPPVRLAWEQAGLPLLVHRVAPDVLHSPHYTMPLATTVVPGTHHVVTLHDATFFSDPELHVALKARFFRAWTGIAVRRADGLIVPSEATKGEVLRFTHADADRFSVIPHGVDHRRFRSPQPGEVVALRDTLGLSHDQDYIAFLGTLEPRKNVPALVRAFCLAFVGTPGPPTLVLAGGAGWDDGIDMALAEVPDDLTVIRPGFMPDALVPALLGGAALVAYPAFGEGFGLPVLEAMACGAAVLTTDRLSLSEVGGDAVRYARSPDVEDLAEALMELFSDPAERQRLGQAGLARAAAYTWDKAARMHGQVYESVAAT